MRHFPILAAVAAMTAGCTPAPVSETASLDAPEQTALAPPALTDSSPSSSPKTKSGGAAPIPTSESGPFIGELRRATAVINLLSPGRLEVIDDCLTVTAHGRTATAVFPPGVTAERRDGQVVAVHFQNRRLAVGKDVAVPGGGLDPETPLVRPVPARCPEGVFGVGG